MFTADGDMVEDKRPETENTVGEAGGLNVDLSKDNK